MTKRKIYEKLCYLRCQKAVSNKEGIYEPLQDYEKVDGVEKHPVCSWEAFTEIWNTDFHGMCICNPSEDICCECFILKNKFRYCAEKRLREGLPEKYDDADRYLLDHAEQHVLDAKYQR